MLGTSVPRGSHTFEKTPIKVIHTPLTKTDNFYIEQKNTQDIFPYIIKTAEYIRKKQGYFYDIIVVVHNQLTINQRLTTEWN